VADLAAEESGAEGEGGGGEGDEQNHVGAAADPVGPETEKDQAGEATEAGDVKEGGRLFRHLLVHLHGDIAAIVEGRLNLAGVEAVVGPFPGLHDERSDGTGKEAEGEGNREDGVAAGNETGNEDGANDDGEGDGQVVEHHMEVLGLPKRRNHGPRVEAKGGLFQRKMNR